MVETKIRDIILYFNGDIPNSNVSTIVEARSSKHNRFIRSLILLRDNYSCKICGERQNLNVHHIIGVKQGGKTHRYNLITLCSQCHENQHSGKLKTIIKHDEKNAIIIKELKIYPKDHPKGLIPIGLLDKIKIYSGYSIIKLIKL